MIRLVAAYSSSTNALHVFSSDLARNLSEFQTHAPRPPTGVVWCGSDALLLRSGGRSVVVASSTP